MTKATLDQSNLEDAVSAAIRKRIGCEPGTLESVDEGVVAIPRLDGPDFGKVDWQEVAAELARETGLGVLCVANCDWQNMEGPDEEATFIAFDLPTVPENYRADPYRNLITAVDPANAPSQQDFDNLKAATRIVTARIDELKAKQAQLAAAQKPIDRVVADLDEISRLKALTAEDRDAVSKVVDLDFAGALACIPEVAAAPAP